MAAFIFNIKCSILNDAMMMTAMTNMTVERMRVVVRRLVMIVSLFTSLSSKSYSFVLVFLLLVVRLFGLMLRFLITVSVGLPGRRH